VKPPADLRARILEAARREPATPRSAVERGTATMIAAGYAASMVLMLATGGAESTRRPAALVAVTAAGWLLIAIAAAWGAFGRGRSMLGRSTATLEAVALVTAPLLLGWVAMWSGVWSDVHTDPGNARAHAGCFVFTVMYAAGPLLALILARRGSDPVHPRATGAALGAAAGAWGGVMIDLHCPRTGMLHVALAHVLPVLALAAVGAIAGGRILAVRPQDGDARSS
jgi:hypothetical protein